MRLRSRKARGPGGETHRRLENMETDARPDVAQTGRPSAEHPLPEPPVFGLTGGLNPAARVTAEAEMEGPSPPLSTSDSGHPQMQKSRKK